MIKSLVALAGFFCGIVTVSFLGWTSLFWPKWTDNTLAKIQKWVDEDEEF